MSSVVVNKSGSDQVDIEFIQTGSAAAIATLKDGLLDGNREYVFGIVDLVVDLEATPMFPITEEFGLFTIVRRNVGVSQTANIDNYTDAFEEWQYFINVLGQPLGTEGAMTNAELATLAFTLGLVLGQFNRNFYATSIAEFYSAAVYLVQGTTVNYLIRNGTYYVSPNKRLYSPTQFVQDLSEWCRVFNVEQTIEGVIPNLYGNNEDIQLADIPDGETIAEQEASLRAGHYNPTEFLSVKFSADGTILFEGLDSFWNNFTIAISNYGAALLGFDKSIFTTVGGVNYIQYTGDTTATTFVDPQADLILVGGNTIPHQIQTVVPIFQTCDQRVKVSMHSDLSYPSAINVENEVETRDRDICSSFFTNHITSEITFNAQHQIEGTALSSQVYNGRFAFIKKTDAQHQWSRLINSFDVRLLRFYLQITYRDFDEAEDKFTLSKNDFVIPDHSYYQFVARFISTV